jgi:hypothetical protein
LAPIGVTHFTVPLNVYQLDMETTGELISALKDS